MIDVVAGAKDSLGFALVVADRIGGVAGEAFATAARSAFVDGFHAGLWVGAGAALVGAIAALVWLPARARREDEDRQAAEFDVEHAARTDATTPEPVAAP